MRTRGAFGRLDLVPGQVMVICIWPAYTDTQTYILHLHKLTGMGAALTLRVMQLNHVAWKGTHT